MASVSLQNEGWASAAVRIELAPQAHYVIIMSVIWLLAAQARSLDSLLTILSDTSLGQVRNVMTLLGAGKSSIADELIGTLIASNDDGYDDEINGRASVETPEIFSTGTPQSLDPL